MVLKIDTFELAKACDEAMERKFPRSEYTDTSNMGHNRYDTAFDVHSRKGQMCVLSQSNNASIVSRRNVSYLTHKPKKMFGGKPVQTPIAEVKLLLNDTVSANEASMAHTGVNMIMLYVMDEDTPKLDTLLCVDGNKLVDLAGYIRSNNISVYDFDLMS